MSGPLSAALIFGATYVGIALGGVPGLALDRTGIALLGAIAMVASGAVTAADAVGSIDFPTILLLYSLMAVSAQLRLGGFYTRVALSLSRRTGSPTRFLLMLMAVSAALSAVLANDIVCLAFTPVLCVSLMRASLNPMPFLIGLAASSNIGSAATVIGNPQNMLIGQAAGLHFGRFALWCAGPSAIALLIAWAVIALLYRGRFHPAAGGPAAPPPEDWPPFDRHQSVKGLAITAMLVAMFFTPVPREVSALAAAGVLLMSRRMHTRSILGLVDWHLITLFCALFVVVGAVGKHGLAARAVEWLEGAGLGLGSPISLSLLTVALSNLVSNVPAVMVLLPELRGAPPETLYLLALMSTFAGNLILIGSIANLITAEQAARYGVRMGAWEHARAGIPITAASVAVGLLWAYLV